MDWFPEGWYLSWSRERSVSPYRRGKEAGETRLYRETAHDSGCLERKMWRWHSSLERGTKAGSQRLHKKFGFHCLDSGSRAVFMAKSEFLKNIHVTEKTSWISPITRHSLVIWMAERRLPDIHPTGSARACGTADIHSLRVRPGPLAPLLLDLQLNKGPHFRRIMEKLGLISENSEKRQ